MAEKPTRSGYVDELRAALASVVRERCNSPVSVHGLRKMTGGTGRETWAFDIGDAPPGTATRPMVLRRNIERGMLDGDPQAEFELLSELDDAGYPVPRPWWCVTADSPLEYPFMILERLSGTDIRKHLASHPEVDRLQLGRTLVGLQARLHRLDWKAQLPSVAAEAARMSGPTVSLTQLDRWADAIEVATSDPGPLLATALDWLRAESPRITQPRLVHGDFKTNNLIFDDDGVVTVLDWELAHLGDPIEDLGWTLLWSTQFDLVGGLLTEAEYLAAYEAESGSPIDPDALRYWRLFALVKLAAMFLTGAARGGSRPTLQLMGRALHHIDAELGALLPTVLRRRTTPREPGVTP
jgi:aminoglycoside phosphotransferase (APT) family kinase protein